MKKLALTLAIVLGIGLTTYAAPGYGMFNRGNNAKRGHAGSVYFNGQSLDFTRDGNDAPVLPAHGWTDNQDAPLSSGIALLLGMGGAYLVAKKRREE